MKTAGVLLMIAGVLGLAPAALAASPPPRPAAAAAAAPARSDASDVSPLGPEETHGKISVLLVKGMWSEHWAFDDALSAPAGRYGLSSAYVTQQYGYKFALKYFPDTLDALKARKVVILGNVPTSALARQGPRHDMKPAPGRSDQWLVDYVANGGGLFVLGGCFSFDLETTTALNAKGLANTFKDSALAGILPVEFTGKTMSLAEQNKPLELSGVGAHPILKGLDFKDKPITLFYHPLAVRKDATVILSADGIPMMVVGTYGKGRIAVLLATLHGDPDETLTPYWEWKSWPLLVRNTVDWLAP